jgi:sigma-E factor negative regulatory protein RseA
MNDTPQSASNPAASRNADLSALMDGEDGSGAWQRCSAAWRDDAQARSTWHAYHLIGDVLRSDELAGSPRRDAALLAALRRRLADEPTVLAPALVASAPTATPSAATRRKPVWLLPSAMAAGFVAVAAVLVVSRLSGPEPAAQPVLAGNPAAPLDVRTVGTVPAVVQPLEVNGQLIRDAQLDAYLRAHREMRGSAAAAVPGGAMRSVETIVPQR